MKDETEIKAESFYSSDGIEFNKLVALGWKGRKKITICFVIFFFLSLIYAYSLNNIYKSEAIYTVTPDSNTQNIPGVSAIASLTGINFNGSPVENKAAVVQQTIVSRAFLKHLISFDHIHASIMVSEGYDSENKRLLLDEKKYNTSQKKWISTKPSLHQTHEHYIGEVLSVDNDPTAGFITISVSHVSPIFAKDLLELIAQEINQLMRLRDLKEASDSIEYLQEEAEQTKLIEIKESINELIKAQLETKMLSNVRKDYVLKPIEPPYLPEVKNSPNRMLILLIGAFVGFMIGFLLVLVRSIFPQKLSSILE